MCEMCKIKYNDCVEGSVCVAIIFKKRFANIYTYANRDINKCILLLRKSV